MYCCKCVIDYLQLNHKLGSISEAYSSSTMVEKVQFLLLLIQIHKRSSHQSRSGIAFFPQKIAQHNTSVLCASIKSLSMRNLQVQETSTNGLSLHLPTTYSYLVSQKHAQILYIYRAIRTKQYAMPVTLQELRMLSGILINFPFVLIGTVFATHTKC